MIENLDESPTPLSVDLSTGKCWRLLHILHLLVFYAGIAGVTPYFQDPFECPPYKTNVVNSFWLLYDFFKEIVLSPSLNTEFIVVCILVYFLLFDLIVLMCFVCNRCRLRSEKKLNIFLQFWLELLLSQMNILKVTTAYVFLAQQFEQLMQIQVYKDLWSFSYETWHQTGILIVVVVINILTNLLGVLRLLICCQRCKDLENVVILSDLRSFAVWEQPKQKYIRSQIKFLTLRFVTFDAPICYYYVRMETKCIALQRFGFYLSLATVFLGFVSRCIWCAEMQVQLYSTYMKQKGYKIVHVNPK